MLFIVSIFLSMITMYKRKPFYKLIFHMLDLFTNNPYTYNPPYEDVRKSAVFLLHHIYNHE